MFPNEYRPRPLVNKIDPNASTVSDADPLAGRPSGSGMFTIPERPIRRRLADIPPFVVTRGGEYCFAPGLRALRWLGQLETE